MFAATFGIRPWEMRLLTARQFAQLQHYVDEMMEG